MPPTCYVCWADEVEIKTVQRCPNLGWAVELWHPRTSRTIITSRLDTQPRWALDGVYWRGRTIFDGRTRRLLHTKLEAICNLAVNAARQLAD